MSMSSTAWGIIGAAVCFGGFQVLRYGVGRTAAYVFVGLLVVAYVIVRVLYQRRLTYLRSRMAEMPEEERAQFLQELDPEIAEDLRKQEGGNNKGRNG